MTKHNPFPEYVLFSIWQPVLPAELKHHLEPFWRARSGRDDWASFVKPLGERSAAHWKASEITAHFKAKFGVLFPDRVQALLDLGFPDAPQLQPVKKQRRKTRS
jgi:hypothetical protein